MQSMSVPMYIVNLRGVPKVVYEVAPETDPNADEMAGIQKPERNRSIHPKASMISYQTAKTWRNRDFRIGTRE